MTYTVSSGALNSTPSPTLSRYSYCLWVSIDSAAELRRRLHHHHLFAQYAEMDSKICNVPDRKANSFSSNGHCLTDSFSQFAFSSSYALLCRNCIAYEEIWGALYAQSAGHDGTKRFLCILSPRRRFLCYVPSVLDLRCRSLLLCFGTFCYVPFYMC